MGHYYDDMESVESAWERHEKIQKEKKMADEWDFGFTSEDELKKESNNEVGSKLVEMLGMIMPLLNNLKQNPDKDVIKWEGKQRVKQIDAFIKKLEDFTKQG